MTVFCAQQDFLRQQTQLLMQNYQHCLNAPLICASLDDAAQVLWEAPFAVVSHNIATDPLFNYANLQALELFGYDWDTFTHLPSRLSAEPMNQVERAAFLMRVRGQGFATDYSGVRISKTGRRFQIAQAVVWNLFDQQQQYAGQAACFKHWVFL